MRTNLLPRSCGRRSCWETTRAGDTVGAIFLAQLSAGAPAHAAFACGLAAGSASCRQLGGADFTMDDLHEILAKIQVSRITRWWTSGETADEKRLA